MYAIRYKELVKKDEGINNNMAKKRDKKNKLRGKWLRGIIIVYLLLILCNLFHEFPSRLGNLHSIPVSEEWYLIVVNRWNEIPEDYRVELTELSNGQKVDSSRTNPLLYNLSRSTGLQEMTVKQKSLKLLSIRKQDHLMRGRKTLWLSLQAMVERQVVWQFHIQ